MNIERKFQSEIQKLMKKHKVSNPFDALCKEIESLKGKKNKDEISEKTKAT